MERYIQVTDNFSRHLSVGSYIWVATYVWSQMGFLIDIQNKDPHWEYKAISLFY